MSRFGKIFLFGLGIAVAFTAGTSFLVTKINNNPESIQAEPIQAEPVNPPTLNGQDLTALLETHQTPQIVKCNFTGTYKVTQLIVFPKNGASCDDLEPRILTYDNLISVCSRYLDSNQELFLNCESSDNPVSNCDGVILINVNGIAACEYWVKINRTE